MSECKIIIQRFVENPESIQNEAVQRHMDECPKCKALFTVIKKGTSEKISEVVHELTQQERTELLTKIRRQEQLLLERDLQQEKMFFFKPKFTVTIAGIIIIMASWISHSYFWPDEKQKIMISHRVPESRKMELLIQGESRPILYLKIEYFPGNKS